MEAERFVLGAIMLDGQQYELTAGTLSIQVIWARVPQATGYAVLIAAVGGALLSAETFPHVSGAGQGGSLHVLDAAG